ncbi:papain family cysteine protease (macronuclear) [Tetrahymena thermophila SB210]|uniref:Papain family cysteine protease n=1 Tax=Tetrahymena thermophila (strain SB210) TaxID=312017 RepID=Q22RC9_TETTS|nr:papain family cysteine protease [Tetrahymena thermophila SB210]EAR88193.1 papain family cysteine protease [Tetrahymena thermophila SB210]|eukprot:XP_001008438.1 papain family cysteine protease [Tetrahymena thermophila SB210]
MRITFVFLLAMLGVSMAIINQNFHYNSTKQLNLTQVKQLFSKFKAEHKKFYNFLEEQRRFEIFRQNLDIISELNQVEEGTAEYGITQFSDMTTEEFKSQILIPSTYARNFTGSRYHGFQKISQDAPTSYDWRDHGAVTPVKNQGTVGTCWTFSTTGNIEGQWFLAGNPLVSLSEEQIVDCDGSQEPSTGHADCGVFGGWPYLAFDYVINAGGLPSEETYPYCVGNGGCYPCPAPGYNETLCGPAVPYCNATAYPCRQGQVPIAAKIEDWKALSKDEDSIKQQLFEIGPLSVALDASYLQFYKKGISAPKFCSKTTLNHAVLLTGYGIDNGVEFWNVKNSWGAKWGEQGYFRLKRGVGMCGINTQVATAIVSKQAYSEKFMEYEDYEQPY